MRNLFLLMTTLFALSLCAQTPKEENVNRNEIRIGVGDPFLDMIFMHTDVGRYEYVNQRFTGNLFVEYQYRINDWLSVGGKATYSAILYDTEYYSSSLHLYENREAVYRNRYSMRASLMPTVRFTYVCKQLEIGRAHV